LEILKDTTHEDYHEMREWLGLEEGDKWDVNEFDLFYANAMVSQI
jgi:hypothetical protein